MSQKAIIYGNAGGGGIKGGEITLSQGGAAQTIQTGLQTIKRFTISRRYGSDGSASSNCSIYDADQTTSMYTQLGYNGSNAIGGNTNINTTLDAARFVKINSISGGDVSVTPPTGGSGYSGVFMWSAE